MGSNAAGKAHARPHAAQDWPAQTPAVPEKSDREHRSAVKKIHRREAACLPAPSLMACARQP
jgi:hypothetical protein